MTVSFTEAKARLSELIAAAERGEYVLIKRRGQPVVRLLAMQPATSGFRFGLLDGEMRRLPDFLDPMTAAEINPRERWQPFSKHAAPTAIPPQPATEASRLQFVVQVNDTTARSAMPAPSS